MGCLDLWMLICLWTKIKIMLIINNILGAKTFWRTPNEVISLDSSSTLLFYIKEL